MAFVLGSSTPLRQAWPTHLHLPLHCQQTSSLTYTPLCLLLLLLLCRAPAAPRAPARSCAVVVRASDNKDNIYHDRETTKSRRSNPAGSKDAAVRRSEKDQQFEYQQER